MYAGFNLVDVNASTFTDWHAEGLAIHKNNKESVQKPLDQMVKADGSMFAAQITDAWFPEIKADVFLSHSHKDSQTVIGLAGWLKKQFGLTAFIDSAVWGYSEHLLSILDANHCWQKESKTYNYNTRNKTTGHVNIMLSSALATMIDACECVIFVNTPESLSCEGYRTEKATESPWIYSELAISKIMRRKRRREVITESLESYRTVTASPLKVKYDADLSHLISLDVAGLNKWRERKSQYNHPLDALYDVTNFFGDSCDE